jgi:hypothetical protein
MKLLLERRAIDALTPYGLNSKNHGDGDVAAIANSISRFGFNDPIGITPEGIIVEGHGRLEAAKRLGLTEVPVIVLEGGDDRQYDLYRIAHNKIALTTGFNFEVLVDTLREVTGDGEVQVADMGFSMQAFDDLCDMFSPEEGRAGRQSGSRPQAFEYEIIWDSKDQKDKFNAFLKRLKAGNPSKEEGSSFVKWASANCADFSENQTTTVQQEQTNG